MSQYRFATLKHDYSLYSSGVVVRTGFGRPGFPIRLAAEIVQTCVSLREKYFGPLNRPAVIYDPCCGSAFLLSIIALYFWGEVGTVIGSDVDDHALMIAKENLRSLNISRLRDRISVLQSAKPSTGNRLTLDDTFALNELYRRLDAFPHELIHKVFRADASNVLEIDSGLQGAKPDFVIADVPYSHISSWKGSLGIMHRSQVTQLLCAVAIGLLPTTIVAIISRKDEIISAPHYRKLGTFKLGKRKVTYLALASHSV